MVSGSHNVWSIKFYLTDSFTVGAIWNISKSILIHVYISDPLWEDWKVTESSNARICHRDYKCQKYDSSRPAMHTQKLLIERGLWFQNQCPQVHVCSAWHAVYQSISIRNQNNCIRKMGKNYACHSACPLIIQTCWSDCSACWLIGWD